MRLLYLTMADVDDRSYGGAIRSHHLREAMLELGEVDTLVIHRAIRTRLDTDWQPGRVRRGLYGPGSSGPLGELGQRLAIRRWVRAIVHEGRYDAIVARYVGLALFVPRDAWPRLVIDADDIVKSIPADVKAPLDVRVALWLRNRAARAALTRARHVWFVNPADGTRLRARGSSWVPNIVSMPDRDRVRAAPVAGRLLMVGYFNHAPNAQGLQWFASEVLPALVAQFPQVELHVVGKHPAVLAASLANSGVVFHGFVESLQLDYDRAALVVAPIQFGGGTQIKVIDALAHGRPLVASRFAHAGFAGELTDGVHLRVAEGAPDWIAQCAAVLRDPAAAEAMAQRGQAVAADTRAAQRVVETVHDTLSRIVGDTPAAGPRTGSGDAGRR